MTSRCDRPSIAISRSKVPALLLAALWFQGAVLAAAPPPLPAVPAGFILDEARALPDAQQAALADELRRFRETTGCGLWVVTTTYLSGKTTRDHANALSDSWSPDGAGMIIVYDRASDSHAVAPARKMWETYPTPALVEAFRDAGTVFQTKGAPLDVRLLDGTRLLMQRISDAERQRRLHNQLLPGYDFGAALVFFAVLVTGTLVCMAVMASLRRRDAASAIRYFFPQADVAMRFGAPYGGGVIAEVRISRGDGG